MTTVLCTLYNSLYLDKGLVLYDSLCECAKDFKLYVLCMDDKCYEVLTDLHQENHIPIKLSDFELGDEELLKAKGNRSFGEYCWTCTSSLVRYVLKKNNEPICTYIDADMYFYNDPQILVDEMLDAGKSVMVTPHRFPKDKEYLAKKVGKYCVEFNTFANNSEGLQALEYWRNRCVECCSNLGDGIHWGDQKYLEELVEKFDCMHVCQNPGAGIAPWNISLYSIGNSKESAVFYKLANKIIDVVFYHYQGIIYSSRSRISITVQSGKPNIDYNLVEDLYHNYLLKIENKKRYLEKKYYIEFLLKRHPSSNKGGRIRNAFRRTLLYKFLLYLLQVYQGGTPYMIELGGNK